MDLFTLLADSTHIFSNFVLLIKILNTKSVAGISLHSQLLYLSTFILRLAEFPENVEGVIRIFCNFFLAAVTICILWLLKSKKPYCLTLEEEDKRLVIGIAGAAIVLGIALGGVADWVDCMGILPQLVVLRRSK